MNIAVLILCYSCWVILLLFGFLPPIKVKTIPHLRRTKKFSYCKEQNPINSKSFYIYLMLLYVLVAPPSMSKRATCVNISISGTWSVMSAHHRSVLLCWDCKGGLNALLIPWVLLALVINYLSSSVYCPWWCWIQISVSVGKPSDPKCSWPLKTSLRFHFNQQFITFKHMLFLYSCCSSLTSCCAISL